MLLPCSEIVAGNNDRTVFDPDALAELANSIREVGLIQPITVRVLTCDGEPTGLYSIVAGERRFRAVSLLGWAEVPAIIADLSDEETAAIMLAENVSRADLDPVDEGRAYVARMGGYGWTAERCAQQAGVSVNRVRNRVKVLCLHPDLLLLVRGGSLPIGYAQILADAHLDTNRQFRAFARLRDNPTPTLCWFRRQCANLAGEQQQQTMEGLDSSFFVLPEEPAAPARRATPPEPGRTVPPAVDGSPTQILAHQVAFWQRAADEWDTLGRAHKRNQCLAAAAALTAAAAVWRSSSQRRRRA